MVVDRRIWVRRAAGAVAAAVSLLLAPAAALASHDINGVPQWFIPWYATALLMAVPYLLILTVGAVVYRYLRREFGNN